MKVASGETGSSISVSTLTHRRRVRTVNLSPCASLLRLLAKAANMTLSMSDNAEGRDDVVRLCSSWKALCLTHYSQSTAATADAQQHMRHTSPSWSDRDHSERGSSSSSSSSSSMSDSSNQRSWVQGQPDDMWTASYDSMSDTRMVAGDDGAYCHEYVSTECAIDDEDDACLEKQEYDCYSSFRRLEVVDLTLPLIATAGGWDFSSHAFWAQTASNLERLVGLGLVGKVVVLVGRGANGEEIEMEVDAAGLRRWGGGGWQACANSGWDVWALRVRADTETMRSHGIDCPQCASSIRATATLPWHPTVHRDAEIMHSSISPLGSEAASAWWERAMCLAEYMTFLAENSRVGTHKESSCAGMVHSHAHVGAYAQRVCSSQVLLQVGNHGSDLDFLGFGQDCDSWD